MKAVIFTYSWPTIEKNGAHNLLKACEILNNLDCNPAIVIIKSTSEEREKISAETLQDFKVLKIDRPGYQQYGGNDKNKHLANISSVNSHLWNKLLITPPFRIMTRLRNKTWTSYKAGSIEHLLNTEQPDLIITSGPLGNLHLLGNQIKQKYGLQWVADIREPWQPSSYLNYFPACEKVKDQKANLKKAICNNADLITTESDLIRNYFSAGPAPVEVIYNGFSETKMAEKRPGKYFTMQFMGNLTMSIHMRDFWQAVSELRQENEKFRSLFRLKIIGHNNTLLAKRMNEYRLHDCLEFSPATKESRITELLSSADCLLLIDTLACDFSKSVPGKLFRYIATCNPILAIGNPQTETADILKSCRRHAVISPSDKKEIKERLLRYFSLWSMNNLQNCHNGQEHLAYSRYAQLSKFRRLLKPAPINATANPIKPRMVA